MPVDPRIALGVQQPKIAGPADMAEFKNMLQRNKLNDLELQQMGQQVQGQNALRSLYANPTNFKDGAPTDEAVRSFGAGGGDVATLRNRLLTQQQGESAVERNLAQARKINEEADREQSRNFARAILPVGRITLKKYEDLVKKGVSPEEATKQAQAFYLEQIGDMETAGSVSKKYVDAAKQSKFNPYAFQVRIAQFSHMLGEKTDEPKSGIGKLKEDLEAGRISQKEYDAAVKKQTYIKPVDGSAGGTPGAAGGGLPKGVVEYVDLKTNSRYGVGKGMAYKLDESGKWVKTNPKDVPTKIVKVGSAGAGQGAREAVFTQRMFQAANQASYDMENIANSPITVTSGVLGSVRPERFNSYMDATKTALANKLTDKDAQVYNVKAAGLQRTLAAIESAGLMPSGQLVHQMEAVIFRPGDYEIVKLHKLAQARQIVESGIEVMNANPRVSEDEKVLGKKVVDRIRKAIPFTHRNLDDLSAAQEVNPKTTMRQLMDAKKKEAGARGVDMRPEKGDDPKKGAKKSYSSYWSSGSGSRGSAAPKNVQQSEDPDEDSDTDKE